MAMGRPSSLPPPSATPSTVFVDSSIGTHLAMAVYPADTVADFKRKITIEHALCFPAIGKISVQALKVKRRGVFYHLSDTMLVVRAFDGNKSTWFLHVDINGSSVSKHQGGAARHFVNYSRELHDEDNQLLLKARLNMEENLQSIDDGSNLHEKVDHIILAKEPTPGSCQVENLVDASVGQLVASDHNNDEGMHNPIEGRTEVFNNGGSLGDKETSNLENVPGVHLATNMDSLLNPEECAGKLPAGDSSLIEHHTDDKKKKKKNKGSRPSKSQQTEVDSVMPLNSHHPVLSPTSEEQNTEHGPSLEKNDVLGYVPATMEGNNEALMNSQKDPIKKVDDGTNQTSENIADEDSAGFDYTIKNDVPGFNSKNVAKSSYSTHLSGTIDPGKGVEAGASEVALNCIPDAVIIRPEDESITEVVPLTEANSQIPTNFHSKKRSSKRLSKNALGSKDPIHSTELANEENSNQLHESDHKDINKESNTMTNKEAPNHGDIANLDADNPSADDIKRSHHKKRRKSEKAASAAFQPNNHEPVHSLQNLTDKEKLDDQKQQEFVVTTEVDVLAHSAGQDSMFLPKPDHSSTNKEASSHENIGKLDTETPSIAEVGRSHHKKKRKSEKAAAKSQPNSHEPIQSLQNYTDKEKLEKLVDQKQHDLDATTEVDVLADSTAQDSVFPHKPEDIRTEKEASSCKDVGKLDTENPYVDNARRLHHKKKRKSSKAESSQFQHNNLEEAGSAEIHSNNLEEVRSAEFQPNNHEPVQSLPKFVGKENLQEKLDEQNAQESDAGTEANREMLNSGFPPKPDGKSHRKKKKSSKIEFEVHETTLHDLSHSLDTEVAEARANKTIDHHNEQSGQSELLDNHGEAIIGGSANLNLVVSSGTNDKSRHHRKRKSAKSDLSYSTQDNHDLIYSSESRNKENFEKASTATNDPIAVSNDDPTAVQLESVASGHELPSTEPEPKKQHKSKKKRKASKHDTTHDLVDPSELDKQTVAISEHNMKTSLELSVSQDEQSKQIYHSKEKAPTKAATKSPDHRDANSPNDFQDETVQVKKNESVNVKAHSIQSQSMATGDDSHHESLPNPAASSDSTQDNTPIQVNKYKLAVRRVPNKSLGANSDSYKPNISFVTSGTIFDGSTSESSEGEFELKNGNATKTAALENPSPLSDSDEVIGAGSKRSAEEGIDREDIVFTQSSKSRKGLPLSALLRSTSSYKKSKVLASQSQADSESQPVDVVPETQPEY